MMRRFFVSIAAGLAVLALSLGCSGEEEPAKGPFSASRKGGYLRLINLSSTPASLNFGERQFFATPPATATSFALYRPGSHPAEVMASGKPQMVSLEVASGQTLTIFVLSDTKEPVRIVKDDPRHGVEGQAMARLTNFTRESLSAMDGKAKLEAAAGSSSEPSSILPGKKTLRLDPSGESITVDAVAGRAYVIVAYLEQGKVRTLVAESGAPMQTAEGGASASG